MLLLPQNNQTFQIEFSFGCANRSKLRHSRRIQEWKLSFFSLFIRARRLSLFGYLRRPFFGWKILFRTPCLFRSLELGKFQYLIERQVKMACIGNFEWKQRQQQTRVRYVHDAYRLPPHLCIKCIRNANKRVCCFSFACCKSDISVI